MIRSWFFRAAALASVLTLAACGGSGYGGGLFGNGYACDPGTQVQLANPTPGQPGVNPNMGSITIVANGNNNTLYGNYQNWYVDVRDAYSANDYAGGSLSLVAYPSGPHPYASDFYYSSLIPSLPFGHTFNAYLVQGSTTFGGTCSGVTLGSFST